MSSDSEDEIPLAKKLKMLQEVKDAKPVQQKMEATPVKEAKPVERVASKIAQIKEDESSSEEDIPLAEIVKRIQEKKKALVESKAAAVVKTPVKKTKEVTVKKDVSEKKPKEIKKPSVEAVVSKVAKVAVPKAAKVAKPKQAKKDNAKDDKNNESESDSEEEYKWWENPEWDDTIKWETLEHCGVLFPPDYQPHGVKMLYDGKEVALEPEAEEVAGFFAALLETDYARNPIFVQNFFADFKATLEKINSRALPIINAFSKCDFTPMFRHFENLKEIRKRMTKEEKLNIKKEREDLDEVYGFCRLDGRKEKVGNYRIEPPGLFRGRGLHPKTGKLKFRVYPEDITINIGSGATVPRPPPGHRWNDVIHNNTVTWLATWTENINGVPKYVQLGATSSLKGKSDFKKFETARLLKGCIDSIRAKNAVELRSKEMAIRQRATALWLIDHLAIRAGNEKGEDVADTVGCCSLRLEHVSLNHNSSEVTFDFLGKDSIRYLNTAKVDPVIVKNLALFMRPPKISKDPIFDRLDTSLLNAYLTSLMPGLTAKVFRTYNASFTMQNELNKGHDKINATVAEKILDYNRANREVAVLCNHQRAVGKSHDLSMTKLNDKIMHLKYHRLLLLRKLEDIIAEDNKVEESDIDEDVEERILKEIKEIEMERYRKKMEKSGIEVDPNYIPPTPCPAGNKELSQDALTKKIEALSIRIEDARHQATDREENKTTALGTSKINYIDPRITVAWTKIHDVPIERMFTKVLRDKFKWALDVPADWRF